MSVNIRIQWVGKESRIEIQLTGLPAKMARSRRQHDRGYQLQGQGRQKAKNDHGADPAEQDRAHEEAERAPGSFVADQTVEQNKEKSVEGQEVEQGGGRWAVGSGQWAVGSGQWAVSGGQ